MYETKPMKIIDRARIVILDNRQRKEFDENVIAELTDSILSPAGLLHPIVLRNPLPSDKVPEGSPADALILVAGETRLKVIDNIAFMGNDFRCGGTIFSPGFVPASLLGDLDEIAAEEAELDENIRRKDLTWQERSSAMARLMKLRQKQAAVENRPAPTYADIAQEVKGRSDGGYQDSIRKDILVAAHLDNPAVAKAKSADDALKILRAEEQRVRNEKLAEVVGKTASADRVRVFNENCLDFLSRTSESYDVILTDPPYGMGAHQFGDAGGRLSHASHVYDDSPEHWEQLMSAWCGAAFRVAKSQAHAYVFCDIDRFHRLKELMTDAGWDVFRTPLIYYKENTGRVPRPEHGPRRQWEMILYAIKGNKPVTHIYPDVIIAKSEEASVTHGAQKPSALFQNLLQRSVKPGDRVLDTFAGTGPIIPAGTALQCYVDAVELDSAHYATCLKRVALLSGDSGLAELINKGA